ncbi:hypothetical protein [Cohnella thailandensis]|uniref:DUF4367 domain-containing protein n=1 Tax=Cohnella thailandensis TaxID=557557 RepID=A0A841T6D3_9BACL|nr:hypothetical protein [Cohnella thailandensis]MBB6637620.1 hypothetical protein [Cohnella thailandensis]MBP1974204.1 anti-sigma factor RsiW [Cohnella thailandensis]
MTDTDHKLRMRLREESDEMLFANMELSEQTKQRIREQAAIETDGQAELKMETKKEEMRMEKKIGSKARMPMGLPTEKEGIRVEKQTGLPSENSGMRMEKQMSKSGRRSLAPRSWRLGAAVVAVAILIGSGYALVQNQNQSQNQTVADPGGQPSASQPSGGTGAASGSELSSLVTTPLSSAEDAKAAFGEGLRLPAAAPEGFELTEMVAVGEAGQPARDIVLTYTAGDKTLTFSASRMTAAFPTDLFTPVQVGDADGFVFEQPELVELYWTVDGVQYSIIGPVSADSALQIAGSIQ